MTSYSIRISQYLNKELLVVNKISYSQFEQASCNYDAYRYALESVVNLCAGHDYMMLVELIVEDDGSEHVIDSKQLHSQEIKVEDVLRRLLGK